MLSDCGKNYNNKSIYIFFLFYRLINSGWGKDVVEFVCEFSVGN